MKKNMKIFCAVILSTIMLGGCSGKITDTASTSNDQNKQTEQTEQNAKVTTVEKKELKVFALPFNNPGIQTDFFAKYMEDNLGIIVDWQSANEEKLQALMAGGELPDVVFFKTTGQFEDAYKAKLIMPIDDLLASGGQSITKNVPISLDYYKEILGADKYYGAGCVIGHGSITNLNWELSTRWDLYKKLNMPEINTLNDIIPILKDMQALEPKNEAGQTVYGVSMWPDWDANIAFLYTELSSFYGREIIYDTYAEADQTTGKTYNILSEDSYYKEALEFFYELNQNNLMDPESITQKFDNARAKYKEGRALLAFHGWVTGAFNTVEGNDEKLVGFVPLYPKDAKVLVVAGNNVGNYPFGISTKAKDPELAMKFLNFWYSDEAVSLMYNGVKGEDWDIVDGKATVTEKGWEFSDSGKFTEETGKYSAIPSLSQTFISDLTKGPIGNSEWETSQGRVVTKLKKDYNESLKINKPSDLLLPTNGFTVRMDLGLLPPIADDVKAINAKIAPIVKANSWKMIFAKDKAEFDALWEDMKTKAEGLGLEKSYQAGVEAYKVLNEQGEKYGDPIINGLK